MKHLLAAIAFLTRVPVRRPFDAIDIGHATAFFPLVGAGIGIVLAGLLALAGPFLPPLLSSLSLIAVSIWVTGALHLDGLADVADGFGGGSSPKESLRIMRDPSVGAFGATALVLVLLMKLLSIGVLIDRRSAFSYLVLGPTLSRWTMVATSRFLPYARPDGGLGAAVHAYGGGKEFVVATGMTILISTVIGGIGAVPCWIVALAVTAAFGHMCHRRLGGFTGDTLGANAELSEAAIFVTAVVLTR